MIDCLLLSHELTTFSLLLIICHIRIVTQKIVVLYFLYFGIVKYRYTILCVCFYIYIYIYIERERERERGYFEYFGPIKLSLQNWAKKLIPL